MTLKGRCHCGAIQFEVSRTPESVTQCNCSICYKKGALHAYYKPAEFRLTTARDRVSTYQWNDYMVEHHHCSVCGVPAYSEMPGFADGKVDYDNPKVSVNARLFEDFDVEALPVVRVNGRTDW
jgi:hypothetical protein